MGLGVVVFIERVGVGSGQASSAPPEASGRNSDEPDLGTPQVRADSSGCSSWSCVSGRHHHRRHLLSSEKETVSKSGGTLCAPRGKTEFHTCPITTLQKPYLKMAKIDVLIVY